MKARIRAFLTTMFGRPRDADARNSLLFAIATVVVGLSLFFPRPQNFAPIGALGLFAGAYAHSRHSWLFPLGAITTYTVVIGGYHWLVLSSVYLGFLVSGLIGQTWLRNRVRPSRVGAAALGTSTAFFLISNLGSWVAYGIHRGETLIQHYVLGIPFFWNTLFGDLFFSTFLFGTFALVSTGERTTARRGVHP